MKVLSIVKGQRLNGVSYFSDAHSSELIACISSSSPSAIQLKYSPTHSLIVKSSSSKPVIQQAIDQLKDYLQQHLQLSQFTVISNSNVMHIGMETVVQLELLECKKKEHRQFSLFATLNYCQSVIGATKLRCMILEPSFDQLEIQQRQQAIIELKSQEQRYNNICVLLKALPDLNSVMASLAMSKKEQQTIKAMAIALHIKKGLVLAQNLDTELQSCTSVKLIRIQQILHNSRVAVILHLLDTVINVELNSLENLNFSQRIDAIKASCSGKLNAAREVYRLEINQVNDLVNKYNAMYPFTISSQFKSNPVGFTLCSTDVQELPQVFISASKKVTGRKVKTMFSTLELVKLNERLIESVNEIYVLTSTIMEEIMQKLRFEIPFLDQMNNALAELDFYQSLSTYAIKTRGVVLPTFGNTMTVTEALHPIHYKTSGDSSSVDSSAIVPNDVFAFPGGNFQVISGANSAGKSTYIRQVAMLQIMAQMGSYVPAKAACVPLFDALYTRIGSDDVDVDCSTFMFEMQDMARILNSVSDNSLVIIDELCRGTSPQDGLGIAYAMCENLLKRNCTTFFVTHFLELTSLLELYSNVVNLHFKVEHVDGNIKYLYTVVPGTVDIDHYGIALVKSSDFPSELVQEAAEISATVAKRMDNAKRSAQMTRLSKGNVAKKLVAHLLQLTDGQLGDNLYSHLKALQQDIQAKMQ